MIITRIAIFALWFAAVFDPVGDLYSIRYIALATSATALTLHMLYGNIKYIEKSYRLILIIIISVIMPSFGAFMYSLNGGGSKFIDTSYIASGVLIITSLLYRNYNLCLFGIQSFVFCARILSIIIIAEFICQTFYPNELIYFFVEKGAALVSTREYAGVRLPYIYFLASPLLILLLGYDFNQIRIRGRFLDIVLFIATTFSLALSGTRAHIIISILFIPIYHLMRINPSNLIKTMPLIILITPLILLSKDISSIALSFFSSNEASNSVKLSYLNGYATILDNPLTLLFGQGFNAHEWSSTFREMIDIESNASKTELTYIELFRVFGMVISTAFLLAIFFTIKSASGLQREMHWLYPSFLIYLLNSSLNPYLFSTNGMLSLSLLASIIHHSSYTSPTKIGKSSLFVNSI